MTDDLRKLAEDAIEEAIAYRRGEGSDPDATVRFHAAANPDVVLGLLDERDDARAAAKRQCERRAEVAAERDEARESVRRLAGALVNMMDDGDRTDRDAAEDALADPVVRRIVEGG